MAPLEKSRAWPEIEPLPDPGPGQPRLRPAGGGGRKRGDREAARRPGTNRELWLAIHLSQLVLESLAIRKEDQIVVVDQERGGKVVCACSAAAVADGIAPGMALNSALALQPRLTVQDRDPHRERALLENLAEWAGRYTPRVSLEPPDSVLLEVRGSLRLFGGSRRLLAEVHAQLEGAGLAPRLALTPTPLASLWLARADTGCTIGRREDLAGRLAVLSLGCTGWPERSLRSLATMGVLTVGDCLRLPRDGFARRFGPGLLEMLDRALGRRSDPRGAFLPRERYTARRDLEPEVEQLGELDAAAAPLLTGLCAFLRQRQCGVQELELRLEYRESPPTRLRLRCAEPVADPVRIARLLGERLARFMLPEPVRALRIRSGALLELRAEPHALFAMDRQRSDAGVPQLVERLQARLGADAVYGLRVVPEHRPEKRSAVKGSDLFFQPPRSTPDAGSRKNKSDPFTDPLTARPLWLLAEPQALPGAGQPRFDGPLQIEEDPERIESGWWDGRDVTRDYYIARNPAGARLWVFRERRPPGRWFLHGIFG